jgi:glutathione synthase/RimK-type ligase-like ATP-grasp enzyme
VILKPEQLKIALEAGFKIPRTLCSNSPARIRELLRRSRNGVIYKPFTPASWRSQEGLAVAFSSLVTEEDLPDDEILRATPGIFQEYVQKSYELRVTAIGRRLFTVKLRSQEVLDAKVDWRAAPDEVPMEPADLPPSVESACLKILDTFGLVFGCFDLIVTPDQEYVFLEVNEMGAFLWIESQLPELGVLDAFSELLIQAKADFAWKQSCANSRWSEIVQRALQQSESESMKGHITSPSGDTFDEDQ